MSRSAIVSIHDIRPSNLSKVAELCVWLENLGVPPVTLLVVPGADWEERSLDRLKGLASQGHVLAGHGWSHRARPALTLGHHLHSALISRDQAEHLSRPTAELVTLVARCHDWFGVMGLPLPDLYVPPAWALGSLRSPRLSELPFRWYEVLTGFLEAKRGKLWVTPLIGFEADTRLRELALRGTNAANLLVQTVSGRPIRIAIHPSDLSLRMEKQLRAILERGWRFTDVGSVLGSAREPLAGSHRPGAV